MKWQHPQRYQFRVSERARQGLKRGLGGLECERRRGHAWAAGLVCLRCGTPKPEVLVFEPLAAPGEPSHEQNSK